MHKQRIGFKIIPPCSFITIVQHPYDVLESTMLNCLEFGGVNRLHEEIALTYPVGLSNWESFPWKDTHPLLSGTLLTKIT